MYDETDDMPCGESGCYCRCQGGAGHACGCDCGHDEDCDCEACVPDDEYYLIDDEDDAEEWQPGTCDLCPGSTAEDLKRAQEGPGIFPVCACAIGQGAESPDECLCGPQLLEGEEKSSRLAADATPAIAAEADPAPLVDRSLTAVEWLEKDYDQALKLITYEDEHPEWGPYIHFKAREIQRRSNAHLMFTIKQQNG